ncbi:MAG: hypothetical protein KJ556_21745 [Gammaproteobacteria bacterium]|nr:hypothetical protein [Gammaproteobacteria bacterium]
MKLHKNFGLNPTIPTCFYCGGEKDELILLGAASKKITGQEQAPMRGLVFDKAPCDQCKKHMEQGVILIGIDESRTHDKENPWRTGHFLVVSEAWVRRCVSSDELRDNILKQRVVFVPGEMAEQMLHKEEERKMMA